MIATPRPSATVVLLRESNRGPEILFVKRRSGDAFGDAWTFPGGVLDDDEHIARTCCCGLTESEANSILGVEEGGLDYFSTAVRELFEETGVLLVHGTIDPSVDSARRALISGDAGWTTFLESNGLTVACDSLDYFSHWITPTVLPKRWTTRFFLGELPAGQEAEPDGMEVIQSIWLTADEALGHARDGRGKLPYPTRKTLESFAGLDSIDAFRKWARQRRDSRIRAIQPDI